MTVGSKTKSALANLKGIESTLRVYSIQGQSEEEKKVFEEAAGIMVKVVNDLEARIKTLEYEEPQYKDF